MTPFVHLHNHTEFSLLDGAQPLDRMLRKAKDVGMPAVAITDHGNLFGAFQFYQQARKLGIKPVLGVEAYVAPGDRTDRTPNQGEGRGKPYHHLILLAETKEGFQNLVALVSRAYLEGFYYRPRMDKALLREHHRGLIALSGCLGAEIPTALRHGRVDVAERALAEFLEIFGPNNFFLELQDQGLAVEKEVNEALVRMSEKHGVPLVVTNDNHFLDRDDQPAHDILICIGTGKTVDDASRMTYTWDHYFKTGDEMAQVFGWIPAALTRTVEIAERCNFDLERTAYHVPQFQTPAAETIEDHFAATSIAGFEERRAEWERQAAEGTLRHTLAEYRARLDDEIRMIRQMGFAGYFLIVWDLIRFARQNGIPVGPGRGSAAGSLVAYSLRITDIDPLQYDLIFERFLNPERISLPDIDIDFCFRGRARVIEYVTQKYGRENVAQIITFGTMAAKAVLRDAGRALGMPYGDVDRIAKLVPQEPGATLEAAVETVPQLADLYREDASVRRLIDVGRRLEGLSRHASTHAAGVVIAPRPLVEYVPLFRTSKEEITTQWPMGDIEENGLLKMDFLGLKTLTLLADCVRLVAKDRGVELELERLPLDDLPTYELFARAQTSGIFQFESGGMQEILRKLKPDRFEDLIALNALYRPGPIGSGMIDDFVKRRHGKVQVEYPHPSLEPILRDTYGVIIYQEQVMKIASTMGGYSLGRADLLRRAMGKKKADVMKAEREQFVAGARDNGVSAKDATRVFDLMEHFAGYGFNRSHSAAYALVAFRTAYLKAHYPVHFMAALLTTEKDNTDKLAQYILDSRAMGISVLPPDLNTSAFDFSVEGSAIRFGLSAVKNVGEGAVTNILEARSRVGAFTTLHQFCREVEPQKVAKRATEALIKSGAFDGIGLVRPRLMKALDQVMDSARRFQEQRLSGQASLFGGATEDGAPPEPAEALPEAEPWTDLQLLAFEKETLGFYVTGHPLAAYADVLAEFGARSTSQLGEIAAEGECTVGGMITGLRPRKTRKGDWMAVFVLEDLEGTVETLVFPEAYKTCGTTLADDLPVLLKGKVEAEEGRVRLIAQSVLPLADARRQKAEAMLIRLTAEAFAPPQVEQLRSMLAAARGDCPVFLEIRAPGQFALTVRAEAGLRVVPTPELTAAIERLCGQGAVKFRVRRM